MLDDIGALSLPIYDPVIFYILLHCINITFLVCFLLFDSVKIFVSNYCATEVNRVFLKIFLFVK